MSQQVDFDLTNSSQPEPPHTMEIAGVAIGILPLVSLFENAIACFTRVKMAKSFGPDLQFFMVRLEVLHLRLTRWGKALGLNKPTKDNQAPNTNLPTSDQKLATKVLEQIKTRFEDAAKVVQDVDIGEDLAATTADLGDKGALVEGLRTMSIKRHPRPSTMTKAKCVIYQKERLSDLIEDLSKSLNELDQVLPADSAGLTQICDEEAGELLDRVAISEAAVALLEDVTAKLDRQLGDAIARRRAPVSTNYHQKLLREILTL